jgi:hypothetical protein
LAARITGAVEKTVVGGEDGAVGGVQEGQPVVHVMQHGLGVLEGTFLLGGVFLESEREVPQGDISQEHEDQGERASAQEKEIGGAIGGSGVPQGLLAGFDLPSVEVAKDGRVRSPSSRTLGRDWTGAVSTTAGDF